MQLGADSLDLEGIAENISLTLSLKVTSMTLLEHCSLRALSEHLAWSTMEEKSNSSTLKNLLTAVLDVRFPQSIA